MKKIFMLLLMLMLVLNSYAQANVTKFLGMPVDGSREKIEKQLKEKGFRKYLYLRDTLEGEFNGRNVMLRILTNKDKVWRIAVMDSNPTRDESQIINRFNELYNQFLNNPKYALIGGEMIDREEDISYEMIVKNKTYEAGFYQLGTQEEIDEILLSKYTEKQLSNPSKKLKKEMKEYVEEISKNKIVWFAVDQNNGEYNIVIFYDNVYNQSNGEDL